jgi:hypothetical protein
MTRACASCGRHLCDGIECYLADPADYPGDDEYTEWLAKVEQEEIELQARLNKHLEPKRRRAA